MNRHLWILALPALAAAQFAPVDIAAPTLGYVWEEQSHALRPIEGVPGAATVGSAVNLGTDLERIAIAPNRRYAIGYAAGAGNALIVRLDGAIGSAHRSELPAGNVFFSPSGETIAFTDGDRVEVWTGLPDRPVRARSFAAGGLSVERAFVSDDGNRVLTISAGSLHRLTADGGAPELIGEDYRDAVFLRHSQDAITAHRSGLLILRKVDGPETLLSVEGALSLTVSGDDRLMAVLVEESILLFDLQSHQAIAIPLEGMSVNRVTRAQGNAVFQLNAGREIRILDGDSGLPRLVAVTLGGIQ